MGAHADDLGGGAVTLASRESVLGRYPFLARFVGQVQRDMRPQGDYYEAGEVVFERLEDGSYLEILLDELLAAQLNDEQVAWYEARCDNIAVAAEDPHPETFFVAVPPGGSYAWLRNKLPVALEQAWRTMGWSSMAALPDFSDAIVDPDYESSYAPIVRALNALRSAAPVHTVGALIGDVATMARFVEPLLWVGRANAGDGVEISAPEARTIMGTCKYLQFHVWSFDRAEAEALADALRVQGFTIGDLDASDREAAFALCGERFGRLGRINGRRPR